MTEEAQDSSSLTRFWRHLGPASRISFSALLLLIVLAIGSGAYWLLQDNYVVVVHVSSPDKMAAAVREVDKLKIPYRVSADGLSLKVPPSEQGRVQVGLAADGKGLSNGAGFELFNNSDFSTTEFTEKVNYQRALQAELARTIAGFDGVAHVRVHLVLPEFGFFRREDVHPSAGITVAMEDGHSLTPAQVKGIRQLVAASVPQIKLADVAVIDQSGVPLTATTPVGDDAGAIAQLEFQRQVDSYLEAKIRHVLQEVDENAEFSVSVDATIDEDEVKITTEDVLPAADPDSDFRSTSGLVVREHVSSRKDTPVAQQVTGAASAVGGAGTQSQSRDVEYQVGRRVEQVVTKPGAIQRLSIAVVGHTASKISSQEVQDLVEHAVGASSRRGDAVAVVLLPPMTDDATVRPSVGSPSPSANPVESHPVRRSPHPDGVVWKALLWLLALVTLVVAVVVWRRFMHLSRASASVASKSDAELEAIARRLNSWLAEGEADARGA